MREWDEEIDFLVAGTGAAAMAAAITASDAGLSVLVVESSDKWGGTTAMSGGGVWFPTHPGMSTIGLQDSEQAALTYLDHCVGSPEEVGPASSLARRKAYIAAVPRVYELLARLGMRWSVSRNYPDYYPDLPGGMAGGRSIESEPFNVRKLGPWFEHARKELPPLPIKTDDVWLLARAWSTVSGFVRGVQLVLRTLAGLLTFRKLYGFGLALSSSLMHIARNGQGTEIRLNTPVKKLVLEDGEVVGVEVGSARGVRRIRATRGVMLGAGGFAHNKAWRQKYHGIDGYSSASKADDGSAIAAGIEIGADLALMDDAWWGPAVPANSKTGPVFIVSERSMPYCLVVDQDGQRYVNESTSYVDFGHAMLEHAKDATTNPSWMVLDARNRRRYLFNPFMAGAKPYFEEGIAVQADTLPALAEKMGVDVDTFSATIERFNGFAASGVDADFGRGRTVYDNYYGDPSVAPNPNLGTIEKGPFMAIKLVPGDLGTKGGLLTDEHARVLDTKGAVIKGLYAAGNTTASVMGRTYPGAGSTIGPALIFGYLGARHAAGHAEGVKQSA
ncbi:FAD-binding protein [Pseudenhygromyxa sp. WMMC2535]|uniref:FAD-binding protein n=1 Tax=Pseudenhygromyxa sp. WMMC2535 TaxID=2712867 RepID=UPI001553010D|nr:FAD-binding protein [Pseudenhygromyxa sp. WMMC2535]NVB43090.1 FAD-binding protein [Pseudenhygromyxa sp. WMMC2535]